MNLTQRSAAFLLTNWTAAGAVTRPARSARAQGHFTAGSVINAARTLLLTLTFLLPLAGAHAAALAVEKLSDDGSAGTLRAAIAKANADGAAGTYDGIVFTVIGTIRLTQGELDITAPVTIAGEGAVDLQIDGNQASRVFSISGGSAAHPVIIDNLAVQNGKQNSGSGVYVNSGAHVTLDHCTLSNNSAVAIGGYTQKDGIGGGLVNFGTTTLTSCILSGNSAIASGGDTGGKGVGGGLWNLGTVTLTGCTLSGNSVSGGNFGGYAGNDGGGLYNGGTATLTDCNLSGNSASASNNASNGSGSGLYNDFDATATLTGCTLSGGTATNNGGGLANFGTATLTECTLTGNSANDGGGMYNGYESTATLTSCVLSGNNGNVISNLYATTTLTGCTLSGNEGGIFNDGSTTTLTDDILYGDAYGEVYISGGGSSVNATDCDIQGGYAGTGDFNADPLFDREQSGYAGTTPYALQPGSPCVGAGDPSQAGTQDITGATRANPPTVGAYEGQKANTRTMLASSLNPSVYGQSVTFTASVANTATGAAPTGTVQFSVNGANLGGPVSLGPNGMGSVITTTLPTGSDTIQAFYSGDGAHNGGSATFIQTVLIANTTALTSSLNPSVYGQSVTFTATVNTHGGPAPQGSVQFAVDGVNTGGPVPLTGTQATFATSALALGKHTITAAFTGSGFQTSGATLTQTVKPASVTGVSVGWGSQTAPLNSGAELPWLGIKTLVVIRNAPAGLSPGDVSLTGTSGGSYGPVTVSAAGSVYTVTLAKPITAPDRLTLTVGNAGVNSYSASFSVLPGDVSGDGAVNASDMALVKNAIGGTYNQTDDIDGSSAVDASDYTAVRQRVGTKLP